MLSESTHRLSITLSPFDPPSNFTGSSARRFLKLSFQPVKGQGGGHRRHEDHPAGPVKKNVVIWLEH